MTGMKKIIKIFSNLFGIYLYFFQKGMKMMCDHKNHREPLSTVAMSVDNLWVVIFFFILLYN